MSQLGGRLPFSLASFSVQAAFCSNNLVISGFGGILRGGLAKSASKK